MLDFSGQGGFAGAVEMCSGVGACRKTGGGTMCPSYMVTRDEMHTTRGRANLLRLVMTGELPGRRRRPRQRDPSRGARPLPAVQGVQDRMPVEGRHGQAQGRSAPSALPEPAPAARASAAGPDLPAEPDRLGDRPAGQLDAAQPGCSSGCSRRPPASTAGARCRPSPAITSARWFRRHVPDAAPAAAGTVVLLDDCFTTYNEPEVGIAAVRVLEAAGYRVELAGLACCGRPAISKGLLAAGPRAGPGERRRNCCRSRAQGMPILGCEPSCLVTLVDEYRDFRLGPDAEEVASGRAHGRRVRRRPRARARACRSQPRPGRVLLHGHCQQKAVLGTAGTLAALRRMPGLEVKELDSGCCGMAGSFGYEHGHFEVSVALANRVLIPAALADPAARLVAPGFSCRSQVHGLAGLDALHPIQLLAECLCIESDRVAWIPCSNCSF